MVKPKFELTTDLVKVEKEIETHETNRNVYLSALPIKKIVSEEQTNFKMSKDLKKYLQRWCLENDLSMKEVIEAAIKKYVGYK